jgi:hypothetical protein
MDELGLEESDLDDVIYEEEGPPQADLPRRGWRWPRFRWKRHIARVGSSRTRDQHGG